MDIDHIDKAIVDNYRKLRTRMGVITLAFPVVVIAMGLFWGIGIQPTLSDYYFADEPKGARVDLFPVRLWFCGILFAVGVFLVKYRGFSKNEDRWLSLAGIFALGVAIFPMTSKDGRTDWKLFEYLGMPWLSVHGVSAVLAFACIAVVILWYSDSTLSQLKESNPKDHKRFKTAYFLIGLYMVLAIGTSVLLHYLNAKQGSYILFAEWSGIWAFAAYWFVKNRELRIVAEKLKKTLSNTTVKRTEADIVDKI
ncbi:hypothetical protein J6524_31955 [Bradyrhizobium sp. WSM 1738]|uniref:hypothetical protein n=1 Tax=Bradyrhizobium hereditatis TaxID=2821405 RepID=UPI001CE339BF|nr:hypothetical protein [Bradyrhizobium hereditatis]MCA6119454.1 hypothetical protein [Bradyrhizobium hereditatis]